MFVLLDTYYYVHINIRAMTTIIADKPSMVREDPGEAIVYDQRGQLWFQEAVFYEVNNINLSYAFFKHFVTKLDPATTARKVFLQ